MKLNAIPMVPSMNNAYPSNKYGKRFKSIEYRKWEKDFEVWCLTNSKEVTEARAAFSTAKKSHVVRIDCEFYFPRSEIITLDGRPKRNDTSNRLKILHDGISAAIWLDDQHFFDGNFTKRPIESDSGYCDVNIEWIQADWMISNKMVKKTV